MSGGFELLNLDPFRVAAVFASLGLLSYLMGWAFSRKGIPISLETPILTSVVRMAYGMLLSVPILLLMFAFLPAPYIIPSLAVLVVVAVGLRLRADSSAALQRLRRLGTEGPKLLLDRIRQEPLAYALFAFSFAYFASVVAYTRWPPIGDITMLHGPITTYLAADGYSGVADRIWYFYPVGFHTFPAALTGPFGLHPGEAVFVFGGFIAAFIPSLMYVLARALGARPLIALMSFTAAFIVHPSLHLEKWLLGPFFNGPYPNMVGFLVILLVLIHMPRHASKSSFAAYAKAALLFSAILFFIYPSFVLPILAHLLLLRVLISIRGQRIPVSDTAVSSSRRRYLIAGIVVVVVLAIGGLLFGAQLASLIWQQYTTIELGQILGYTLDPRFFFDNLTGVLVLVGAAISTRSIIRGRVWGVESFYVLLLAIVLLTLHPSIHILLWPILPSRAVIILGMIAWPLLAREVQVLVDKTQRVAEAEGHPRRRRRMGRTARWSPLIAIIIVLAAQGLATGAMTPLKTPQYHAWFSQTPYFLDDFGAIVWLAEEANVSDLILSDGTFVSRYAISLRPLKMTHDWPFEAQNRTAFMALDRVWVMPTDQEYVRQVLKQYDVRYILSTSEGFTLDLVNDNGYRRKVISPSDYARELESYPFLTVEYSAGNTRVFGVRQELL